MTDLEKQLNEEYGDTYERGKNGLSSELTTCPSCGKKTYVHNRDTSRCFDDSCGYEYEYKYCSRCGNWLEAYELQRAANNGGLCSACKYKKEKIMGED